MRKLICRILAAMLLLMVVPLTGTQTALAATDYSNVRVLLTIGSVKTLTIPVSGSYFIQENGASFKDGTLTVNVSGNKLVVSHSSKGELYTGSSLQIMRASISPSAGYFRLATSGVTRSFLGHLTLKYSGGTIRAINVVPLPHYLYGVVAYEMSNLFPLEALKAQAVAAKCYVLANMNSSSDYDIGDTASDQVYKGYNSSYTNVIKAVDATYNVGLYLGSKILCSYFAASNGGYTLLPSDAWGGTNRYQWDKAYDRVADKYDVANPESVQETVFFPSKGDNGKISAALSNYLRGRAALILQSARYIDSYSTVLRVDSIDKLKSSGDSTADIAMTVTVRLSDGTAQQISFDYDNLNLNELVWNGVMTLSASLRLFTVTEVSGGYNVTRARYGHGVGLSQRGAQQMANQGWGYEKILNFYYPGAAIKTMGIAAPADPNKPADTTGGSDTTGLGTPIATAVTTANVNFRAGASSSSSLLGVVPKGASLSIYAQENGFSLTQYNGVAGYISNSYLKVSAATDPGTDTQEPSGGGKTVAAYGQVTSSTLNFRDQPATSGKILQRLTKGDNISIYGYVQNSTWYYCSANGVDGYVSAQYVKLTGTPGNTGNTDTGNTDTSANPDVSGGAKGVITASGVNLRTNPSTSRGTVITKLDANTQVTVLGESGDYYAIQAGSTQGYILKTYVRITSSGASSEPAVQGYGQTTGNVNFRSGPSTSNSILSKLSKGTAVTIYSSANGWYYVSVNGTMGYLSGDYVKVTGSAETGSAGTSGGTTTTVWTGVVVNEYVRMRSTPDLSTQNNIIANYDVGTQVTILGQTGDFYLVTMNGTMGYMHKDYVKVTGQQTVNSGTSATTGVTTATVYLRSGPSTGKSIVTTLKKGVTIVILGSEGDWYQAQAGSYTGYLVKKYVSVQ